MKHKYIGNDMKLSWKELTLQKIAIHKDSLKSGIVPDKLVRDVFDMAMRKD